MLSQRSEEAKLAYNEAKKETRYRMRIAMNEEWIRLGKEIKVALIIGLVTGTGQY